LRAAAFDRFQIQDYRTGAARRGNIPICAPLMRDAKPLAAPPDAAAKARAKQCRGITCIDRGPAHRVVDGAFALNYATLPSRAGFSIRSMADVLVSGDPDLMTQIGTVVPTEDIAVALNTAFMADGAVIRVGPGATLSRPLHLIFSIPPHRPAAVFARSFV